MKRAFNQAEVCQRFGSIMDAPVPDTTAGIALNTLNDVPLNALRHPAEAGTCGWYIWGGEVLPEDPEFFQPLHVLHLPEYCPQLVPYLALAPGWRVLLAGGHEDVWYDSTLLHT